MKKVTKKSVTTENNIPVLLAIFGLFVLMLLALVWKRSLDTSSDAAGRVTRPTYNSSQNNRSIERDAGRDRKIGATPTAIQKNGRRVTK